MKLLIVEDNQQLSKDIEEFLKAQYFVTEPVFTFDEAEEKISIYEYDLVILDLGLPDGNGLNLLQLIRQKQLNTAVIILTATHALEYKLKGLEQGADDYLTKPFHMAELNARIRSILRRKAGNHNPVIKLGDMEININSATVQVKNIVLNLTRKEYDLLLYFIYNQNRLLTKENIAEHLWGDHADQADNFNFVYSHIKNLRKKISDAGGRDYLKSLYGMGYKFETK